MKMAIKNATLVHVDEDYIDMELSSSSSSSSSNNLFSCSIGSPPQNREFEFQMISASNEKDSKTSPADDLFYKGKLLPLHLPPRLQMVQKLIEKSQSDLEDSSFPFPLASSNTISPSESCRVSSEVANPDEIYPFVWSSGLVGDLHDLPKKPLPKKLKQMKQFWLSQRLKASKAYLKSLFSKSGCSDKSCASDANNVGVEKNSSCKECQNKYMKVPRKNYKNPFESFYDENCTVMKTMKRENHDQEDHHFITNHRKSFSGVVQRHCVSKASSSLSTSSSGSSSSSSSFSLSSAGYYDLQLFKRSISANYELEGSVEGAIAHCKQSQQQDLFSVSDKICN